jgi:hypothetical protein
VSTKSRSTPPRPPKKPPAQPAAPPPPDDDDRDDGEDDRERLARISRQRSAKGREIGEISDIVDIKRRIRCRDSLRHFCEIYNPEAFSLAWSEDHLRVIARIEEAVTRGALYALAMPRGSGKTTVCRMAALWAISYAHCRYLFLIGANAGKAEDALDTVKTLVRFLPRYADDFPEVAGPAIALGGIANRASGQTCEQESTLIEWAGDRVVLPTVPPPANWTKACSAAPLRADGKAPTSGLVVSTSGLTGDGIRGSLLTLSTGELLRPDFVLLDDPQTNESAHSKSQNNTREQLVAADVLGMAGPGKTISAVMPCTVIARGDFVDRILDRSQHPLWRGERMRLLRTMPKNMKAWDEYFDVYKACAQLEPPDFAEANALYVARRAVLDKGAEASWPERKLEGEVSAIQHAMHLYCRDPHAFWSEYQNAPEDTTLSLSTKHLDATLIASRLTRVPRLQVPRECSRLTAMIDVGGELLWYCVTAWDERFGGSPIYYGTWPAQARGYFAARDPRPGLSDTYPGLSEEARVYAGLRDLTAMLFSQQFRRHETEEVLSIERCLVDEGWRDTVVYQFCRESQFSALLMPSKGYAARSSAGKPMSAWAKKAGEKASKAGQPSWRRGPVGSGKGYHIVFDADEWKSFVAERLICSQGTSGAMRLYGDSADVHRLFADHCTAEYATPVTVGGRTFEKWQMKPSHDDNHLLDCLVGSAVAAALQGLEWFADPSHTAGSSTPATEPIRYADVIRRRQEQASVPNVQPQPAGPGVEPRKKIRFADVQRRREEERRQRGQRGQQ